MSSNRLMYDSCAYSKKLTENGNILEYVLNPSKYYNCNRCRMQLGIVGGNDVSQIQGNLVDLETELRGTTRHTSLCPTNKYQPPCYDISKCQPSDIIVPPHGCNRGRVINTRLLHLPPCQMFDYPSIPLPPVIKSPPCPPPKVTPMPRCNTIQAYNY